MERGISLPVRENVRLKLPESKQEATITRAKQQIKELVQTTPNLLLDKNMLQQDRDALHAEQFAKETQAVNSFHDIRHAAETEVLSLLIGKVMHARTGLPLNENVLRLFLFHDTQRKRDLVESIPWGIRAHGRKAADRLAELSADMVGITDADRMEAAEVIRVHDYAHLPQVFMEDLTTESVAVADRLALERVIHAEVRKPTDRFIVFLARFAVRLRNNVHTAHINGEEFQDIASALLFLSTQNINRQVEQGVRDPDQFQAVIDAAESLGIVKAPEPQPVSTSTLPVAA